METENGYATQFLQYMATGVELNNTGQHEAALAVRFEAFALASSDTLDAGRAARDISHSLMRIGDITLADAYAEYAVHTHEDTWDRGDTGAEREYRASVGHMGTLALRRAMLSEATDTFDALAAREARDYLTEAVGGPHDDQYTINFSGRRAVAAGLYEGEKQGRYTAREAYHLGRRSESPEFPYSTPQLSEKEHAAARRKGMIRGVAAYAVSVLANVTTPVAEEAPKYGLRRKAALAIASRII